MRDGRFAVCGGVCWHVLILSLGCGVAAEDPTSSTPDLRVWLDPYKVSVGDLYQELGEEAASAVKRLYVTVFANGQTCFATSSKLFARLPDRGRQNDFVADLIEESHRRHISVHAVFEALRWERPHVSQTSPVCAQHPDMLEVDMNLTPGPGGAGKFASIFHPQVLPELELLIVDFAKRYPDIDGIALDWSLSREAFLGFSDHQREAFIQERHLDPFDLRMYSPPQEEEEGVAEWVRWRLERSTRGLRQVLDAFRGAAPGKLVAVTGHGSAVQWKVAMRSRLAEDWVRWLSDGVVDEVLAYEDWTIDYHQKGYSLIWQVLGGLRREEAFAPVIVNQDSMPPLQQLLKLTELHPPPAAVIAIRSPKHMEPAREVLLHYLRR